MFPNSSVVVSPFVGLIRTGVRRTSEMVSLWPNLQYLLLMSSHSVQCEFMNPWKVLNVDSPDGHIIYAFPRPGLANLS